MSVYTKPGKQPSDTISCQNDFITSTIFIVFFACLPSNRSTSFAFKPSYYPSEVWERFVSDYDVYTWYKTVRVVPDPFSYHLLMWSRVVPDCWSTAYRIHAASYKRNPNPIWKGIRYTGDPVSCKQGPSLRKTVEKVSPILVTLTSSSDSNFEWSNISLKENTWRWFEL